MTLIKCNNVTLGYGINVIIKDFSLTISSGDYLCVLGENGSGKSTLLKGLLGLKSPIKGNISFVGLKQNEIGYLPQRVSIQKDFPASVYEIVLSGCLGCLGILSFYGKQQKKIALENMELLGIRNLQNKSFRELSGGQQQRVLLARALCATKKILILDEPCAGLDPIVAKNLYKIIKKINTDKNIAIIMVSHDIGSAISHSNMIVHMQEDKPMFFKTPQEYCESLIGKRFLGGI